MFTNVNLSAPIGAMAFLGTAFLLLLAAAWFAYTIIRRRFGWSRGVLVVAVLLAATYLGIMLIFSATSHEQLLARGQEKHFCEIDSVCFTRKPNS